jgi:hypothetical protein
MNTMDDHGAIFLLFHTKGLTLKTASTAMAMTAAEATAANS